MAETLVRKVSQQEMLEAALDYLTAGRSVIPICSPHPDGGCRQSGGKHGRECPGPGKTPLTTWKDYQTRRPTEAEVRLWFGRWPTMNIGMATGAVSGTVVLDADSDAAIKFALEQGEGELSSAPMVTTGKGAHFYLAHPGEHVPNFAGRWPGVDFRGDGGYVVLPPSLHRSGKRYAWHATPENMGGQPAMPNWLLSAVKHKKPEGTSSEPSEHLDLDEFVDGIGEGARNDKLFRLACKLRGDAMPLEYAKLLMLGAAGHCNPPYDPDETMAIVERVYATYPEGTPDFRHRVFLDDDEESAAEEGSDPEKDNYPFITLDEFLAIEDLDEDWLIDGLVGAASVNWFYADPGVGKTLVALWYALHIAEGRSLQGRQTVQGSVLIVSEDTSARRMRKYIRQLKAGGGFPDELPIRINPHPTNLLVTNEKEYRAVLNRVDRLQPSLVILDCFENITPSKEYKAAEYQWFNALISQLREKGIATIVIDHTNKATGANGAKPKPNLNRVIGGRAKTGRADFCCEFNGSFKEDGVYVTFTKQRDEPPPNYAVTIERSRFGTLKLDIQADVNIKSLTEEENAIYRFLDQEPGKPYTAAKIAASTGQKVRSTQRYLRAMVIKGVVLVDEQRAGFGGRTVRYMTKGTPDVLGVAMAS
jgi:hypothetical protein